MLSLAILLTLSEATKEEIDTSKVMTLTVDTHTGTNTLSTDVM